VILVASACEILSYVSQLSGDVITELVPEFEEHMAWLKLYSLSASHLSPRTCLLCPVHDFRVQRSVAQSSSNYYDVLGVKSSASQSQIKSAYYRLSKLYHPDTAKDVPFAKEKFAALSTAYEVLGNPHKRALYDRKHDPASSFRHVSDEDIEYRDFIRRRGTFSARPRPTAYGTSVRSPGSQFDEFYKKHYENIHRYSWEVKNNPYYTKRRIYRTRSPVANFLSFIVFMSCVAYLFADQG